ncbi:UTRA domain-containing protein [Roseomonas eburnea]|uniref:UTRA domain-containing protein n=1 Tax=Neoroseomonas eburnea TaxID=1346889 RepID=A0A9X9XDQ1_9PROT|nr:UTRA domain-containing protein [Neoroseomonas eburnea]MBR0681837.1 UTRA domain-containing protein [Neoroseomonas eburnea]
MSAFTLDGEGPLHGQIRRALSGAILTGRIPPGGRIPPESELMTLFGASRMTVHRALAALAAEGLVRRNRRAGTVASPEARGRAVFEIWDIGAEIRAAGHAHRFEILSRAVRQAGDDELDLPAAARLLDIATRHLSDGAPMQVEERLINLAAAPAAAEEPFAATPPGRWLLDHIPWTEAEHAIRAVAAPARVARLLGMKAGDAALVVERRTWNGSVPVTFARLWHPGDRHRLVGRFSAGG